ncbi:MAG: type II toxin-antitoxin system VapC family toxin [Gemmatimonadetes bacterium]|nr:type II toxin-antitoxin system VapC family toxin [Gemmatimonadota bacterium]
MRGAVLDTSAYAALLRGHASVSASVQQVERLVLPAVALGELRAGFLGGARRRANEAGLASFLASPRVDVGRIDAETATYYAAIVVGLRRAGTSIPTNDVWIAASAMQHGLPVLTTDAHFERVPQIIVERFA